MAWITQYFCDVTKFAEESSSFLEFKERLSKELFLDSFTFLKYEKELYDFRKIHYKDNPVVKTDYKTFVFYLYKLYITARNGEEIGPLYGI